MYSSRLRQHPIWSAAIPYLCDPNGLNLRESSTLHTHDICLPIPGSPSDTLSVHLATPRSLPQPRPPGAPPTDPPTIVLYLVYEFWTTPQQPEIRTTRPWLALTILYATLAITPPNSSHILPIPNLGFLPCALRRFIRAYSTPPQPPLLDAESRRRSARFLVRHSLLAASGSHPTRWSRLTESNVYAITRQWRQLREMVAEVGGEDGSVERWLQGRAEVVRAAMDGIFDFLAEEWVADQVVHGL